MKKNRKSQLTTLLAACFMVFAFACETDDASEGDPSDVPLYEARDCAADHEKVGTIAELDGTSHDVAGRVEVIDNCTLKVTGFAYDGGGASAGVFFYISTESNFSSGQNLSNDIFGSTFSGDTITLPLPESITLDDFDYISVWCEEFSISFGDGQFL